MWPSSKSFFLRSTSSTKHNGREKGEKEQSTSKDEDRTTPSARLVERAPKPGNSSSTVPAHLRVSPSPSPSPVLSREQGGKDGETGRQIVTHGCSSLGLGYSVLHWRGRGELTSSSSTPSSSSPPPPLPSLVPRLVAPLGGRTSAPPRITITNGESGTYDEESSETLMGDEFDFDFEGRSDVEMSLKSLCHPPPGFGKQNGSKSTERMLAEREHGVLLGSGVFHSQPTHVKAMVGEMMERQEKDYVIRYREFPHAERTADIQLLNTLPTTILAEDMGNHALTPSQYREARKLLQRKKSDWALRKNMLLDSPNHKLYLGELRRKHGYSSDRDNSLEFFIVNLLAEDVEETEWSREIVRKREELVEHGVRCREAREDDGRGALYSVSGPAVRRRKLAEAEERLGIVKTDGECASGFERTSLRSELGTRRSRTESLAVSVGGTPTRDSSTTVDDVGLGNLSASRLAGLGRDSPLSEASDRSEAHVDALRFALGAGTSHLSWPDTSSSNPSTRAAAGSSSNPKTQKQNAPKISSKDPRRQTRTWEPVSIDDQRQESLDRDHQKSTRNSKDEQWGSDSGSSSSSSEDEMRDARERLNEEDIEEARRAVEDAKAKKLAKREELEALEREVEKDKDKTSIEKSFPGRSFF